jgi:hypothetical protein
MKPLRTLLALAALLPAIALAAPTNAPSAKSPGRYFAVTCTFSTTANISGQFCGVLPQAGMVLKDVYVAQNTVGVGGTSWVATPKRAGVALVSTAGGWTLAAGSGLVTNTAASPLKALAAPTGATRPVIQKNVFASQTTQAGTVVADNTVTIGGIVYTAKASGDGISTFTIGTDATGTATALKNAINANPNSVVTATSSTDTVTVYARRPGAAGNAITVASTANFTLGSSTLASGYDYASSGGSPITVDVTLTGSYSTAVTGGVVLLFEPAQ